MYNAARLEMKKSCFSILAALAIQFASTVFINAQSDQDTLRIDAGLVRVPVSVMDKDSRYIPGLKKGDFAVFENGVEQQITYFEPVSEPFTVMLLIDNSGSMIEYKPLLGRAIDQFIGLLRPNDTLIVSFFSDTPELDIRVSPVMKKDYKYAAPANRNSTSFGYGFTLTLDAVENAIKYMQRFKGRRAIVLFGDGDQSGRYATTRSNLRDALEQESQIYTIRYGDYPPACVEDNVNRAVQSMNSGRVSDIGIISNSDLRQTGALGCYYHKKEIKTLIKRVDAHFGGLAELTGGRALRISKINDLSRAFDNIIAELGQQYSLGYEASPGIDGETRKISVKVKVPNVVVRSRNEVIYYKPKK